MALFLCVAWASFPNNASGQIPPGQKSVGLQLSQNIEIGNISIDPERRASSLNVGLFASAETDCDQRIAWYEPKRIKWCEPRLPILVDIFIFGDCWKNSTNPLFDAKTCYVHRATAEILDEHEYPAKIRDWTWRETINLCSEDVCDRIWRDPISVLNEFNIGKLWDWRFNSDHSSRLRGEVPQLINQHSDLRTNCGEQKEREKSDKAGISSQPPFGRRFFIAALCLLVGFGICLLGGEYFYRERRLIGAALFGCGWLLAALGLGLFWLTQFPSTWGWLL